MSRLKKISGKDCIKILCNKFGFLPVRQRGSHVVMTKQTDSGKIGTVVPLHKELKIATLKNALALAKIDEDDFVQFI
ncbi:MAG: type II toxin-antitoxin system HicA family toxin [DPANN group archaeon]|nr:type II toxin-antitoxin system HicA family toxin [DPANN group archaeon]